MAHDAGNLLGALSIYADLLAVPGVLSDEHRVYAEEIRLLFDRGSALTKRLASTRTAEDSQETVVLPDVLNSCKGALSKAIGRTIEVSFGPNSYKPISVSREAIERVLLNLLKNAAEATPRTDTITVTVQGRDQWDGNGRRPLMMTVKDHGYGMSKAALEGLRNSTLLPSRPGRGLGFRIVRELVTRSGGCVDIDSRLGKGTIVTVKWFERRGPM